MFIVTIILSALLGLAFVAAGSAKLRTAEPVTGTLDRLEVSRPLQKTIGALEVLGGIGVIVGIWFAPLGVAAGIGLAATMAGAMVYHLRARDNMKEYSGALMLLVFAVVTVLVRLLTA
ncbi:DoxX family protein [Janibacter sp. GXQ6167]|uniref:DoxX family protein n=1 Tax=Janibacter sp. GXQ6167 TaxID=3240791 RepID=UPI00352441D9